jgi:hypothetical protein
MKTKRTYMQAAENLKAEIEKLHAAADGVIKGRIFAAAAEISNVPTATLKNILVAECGSAFCRCRAIRRIAAGDDGL